MMNWMMTDMNSYFASVEQYLCPELRNHPVAVVPMLSDGTSVIAASQQAKQCGVRVGTGVRDAKRLCPGIRLVPARPKIYVQIHRRILQSVDKCAEVDKVYSIDEWTIRLQGASRQPEQARQLALHIKDQLREDFGPWLTCSIGIAGSRLLAKLASNLQKPDGLVILPVSEMPQRMEHLSLQDLCGIGEGMLGRLNKHGIMTVRQLWETTKSQANHIWGSVSGGRWWDGFHGVDEPEIPTKRSSMTHGKVLDPKFRSEEGAHGILLRLVCKLAYRLREAGYFAQTMRMSIRDVRGSGFSGDIALPGANDTPTLLQQFESLWARRKRLTAPIIKVDVTVGGLVLTSQLSKNLFGDVEKLDRVSQTIDKINNRLGSTTVYFGPIHHYRQPMENKIAFGRIPHEED